MTIAILFKKDSSKANLLLAYIIILCIHTSINNLLFNYLRNSLLLSFQMSFTGINFSFGFAIYGYCRLLLGKKFPKNWYWHAIPSVMFMLCGTYYLFLPQHIADIYLHESLEGNHLPMVLLNALLLLHILIYLIITKRLIYKSRKEVSINADATPKIKSKWANDFVNYMIFNTLILIFSYAFAITFFAKTYFFCDMVILPVISLSIYSFIVYKNFQNAVTFQNIVQLNEPIDKLKDKKSALNETEKLAFDLQLNAIIAHLNTNKSYTQSDLSLQKFASELSINPGQLSQAINQGLKMSFVDLINKYRVDESKVLLTEASYSNLKIEAIGQLAGFSSRSTFFAVFKKYTGLTPSQFKAL